MMYYDSCCVSLCVHVLVYLFFFFFFLVIRRPPRSTLSSSSAASDVYKRQEEKYRKINLTNQNFQTRVGELFGGIAVLKHAGFQEQDNFLVLNEPNIKLLQEIEASLTNEINYS
eukprot:TRINITY_DN22314_c0_g1_i2.p2 TRINITY_DN22314_c0_g1~~TRINITY_DN22314_c0_g1_i2.p2  ORF type:complete len:114 (+),score=23.22 TRINITY_DN22314_c0_g1_i2:26-367(+)